MRRSFRIVSTVTLAVLFLLIPMLHAGTAEARLQDFAELVPIYNEEGASIGQVSAYGIYDPFDVLEPGNEPEPGTHHVLIETGFFNTGTEPLPYDPDGFVIVNTNGFAYTRVMINNLTADSTNYFGQAGTVEPGTDFYGDNAYIVPDGAVIDRIVYSTGGNHISVYDMRTLTNPPGTAVPLNDQSGLPLGEVSVIGVTDPFKAYDPASAPTAGNRYVAVEVMVANQGQQAVPVVVSDFQVIDELGRLVEVAPVTPTDPTLVPLAEGDVQPGGTAQGILIYQLPEAGSIAQVTFADGGARDQVVADLEVIASTSDATGGCAGFVEWAFTSVGQAGGLNIYAQNLQGVNPEALDAGMISIYYQDAASTLEDMRQVTPPPAVESAHDFIIDEFVVPMTENLESLMNAVAAGDYATAQTNLDALTALLDVFGPGSEGEAVIASLQTSCPEGWEELNNLGG